MTRTKDLCHPETVRVATAHRAEAEKIAAKTVCRWLSPDQHRDYAPWIDNDRRLRELLARLETLGAAAFDADPRWERQARQPAEPEPKTPDSVGSTRLTCGRPSTQTPHAQLRAKREDLTRSEAY